MPFIGLLNNDLHYITFIYIYVLIRAIVYIVKDNCIRLANKNKGSFLIEDSPIRANKTWIKDVMRVVQLLQNYNDDIKEIMYIVGNDMVEIPRMLEQGKWR
ncbi:uncharacterized protein METZ01_LOCUS497496 [marine metagenome]|uniref:Uncharacterized protein n=1 Tax=marine metagenome TaxID=408172 RepID=A0A383DJK0_9ZZZZ